MPAGAYEMPRKRFKRWPSTGHNYPPPNQTRIALVPTYPTAEPPELPHC